MTCGYTIACSGCKECEGFCQTSASTHSYSQLVRNAIGPANAPTMARDDIIIKKLPKEVYDNLVNYLNRAAAFGSVNSGGYVAPLSSGDFLKADEVYKLYQHFTNGRLQPSGGIPVVSRDDVVYANYFNELMTKINNATFRAQACNTCNMSCNSNCKTTYRVQTGCNNYCCNCSGG